jgi:hypothetical protein
MALFLVGALLLAFCEGLVPTAGTLQIYGTAFEDDKPIVSSSIALGISYDLLNDSHSAPETSGRNRRENVIIPYKTATTDAIGTFSVSCPFAKFLAESLLPFPILFLQIDISMHILDISKDSHGVSWHVDLPALQPSLYRAPAFRAENATAVVLSACSSEGAAHPYVRVTIVRLNGGLVSSTTFRARLCAAGLLPSREALAKKAAKGKQIIVPVKVNVAFDSVKTPAAPYLLHRYSSDYQEETGFASRLRSFYTSISKAVPVDVFGGSTGSEFAYPMSSIDDAPLLEAQRASAFSPLPTCSSNKTAWVDNAVATPSAGAISIDTFSLLLRVRKAAHDHGLLSKPYHYNYFVDNEGGRDSSVDFQRLIGDALTYVMQTIESQLGEVTAVLDVPSSYRAVTRPFKKLLRYIIKKFPFNSLPFFRSPGKDSQLLPPEFANSNNTNAIDVMEPLPKHSE